MANTKEQDKSVVVTNVEVKVAGETLKLTIADAKKLYEVLGELFANPQVVVQKEYVFWNRPAHIAPLITWDKPNWIVTGTSNNTMYGIVNHLHAEVK